MANPLLDKTGGRTRPLNELQEKERLNSDLARSQKALLRLAIAHYGENTELDQQLTLLSNTIRNPEKRNSLPRLIEDVVATIVSQDTQSRKSTDNPVAAAVCKIMQSLAERLQWEDHNDAPWGAIKHQLQGNPSAKRLNAILEDCLRLICTRVETPPEGWVSAMAGYPARRQQRRRACRPRSRHDRKTARQRQRRPGNLPGL